MDKKQAMSEQVKPTKPTKPVKLGRLEEKAIAAAQQNDGLLTRRGDGNWQGKEKDPTRHACETIATLVLAKKFVYTKDREGSKVHIEGRLV
jgi:hypothetical protein